MNNWLVWLLGWILPHKYWYGRFYLRSRHWREFRERIGNARKWHCEGKGCHDFGRNMDLHHEVYHLWREKPKDVFLLCRHHHIEHHKYKVAKQKIKRAFGKMRT